MKTRSGHIYHLIIYKLYTEQLVSILNIWAQVQFLSNAAQPFQISCLWHIVIHIAETDNKT